MYRFDRLEPAPIRLRSRSERTAGRSAVSIAGRRGRPRLAIGWLRGSGDLRSGGGLWKAPHPPYGHPLPAWRGEGYGQPCKQPAHTLSARGGARGRRSLATIAVSEISPRGEQGETMRKIWRGFRMELMPTLSLAWPVVAGELGWMAMGVVDTIFVGRLGAEAIGAVSIGNMLYFAMAVFALGLLLGLDTLVSQAFGAGRRDECHRWLVQGVYLCLILSPIVMGLLVASIPLLGRLGLNPTVLEGAVPFLRVQIWSTLPLLLFSAFRRDLQAMGVVKPVMFALISANAINALGDWILIYGNWGAPAMGVVGSGWSTAVSRADMAAVVIGYAVVADLRSPTGLIRVPLGPSLARIGRLVALGLPAAVHVTLEVGVFAVATALAGMLEPVDLAAHHVVLDIASVTFMIPLGLLTAGAVRVGQALGRGEPTGGRPRRLDRAGPGGGLHGLRRPGVRGGARDPALGVHDRSGRDRHRRLAHAGRRRVPALRRPARGVNRSPPRGAGDTHTPMVCNLVSHWFIGLPIGYLLCFGAGLGVFGLWAGLALGWPRPGSTCSRPGRARPRHSGAANTSWPG